MSIPDLMKLGPWSETWNDPERTPRLNQARQHILRYRCITPRTKANANGVHFVNSGATFGTPLPSARDQLGVNTF